MSFPIRTARWPRGEFRYFWELCTACPVGPPLDGAVHRVSLSAAGQARAQAPSLWYAQDTRWPTFRTRTIEVEYTSCWPVPCNTVGSPVVYRYGIATRSDACEILPAKDVFFFVSSFYIHLHPFLRVPRRAPEVLNWFPCNHCWLPSNSNHLQSRLSDVALQKKEAFPPLNLQTQRRQSTAVNIS